MPAKHTTDSFIKRAKEIHGNLFDYSETIHIDARQKVKIFCNKHKEFFMQTPKKHLEGKVCPKCGIEKFTLAQRKDPIDIILKFNEIHNHTYDYSLVEYINYKTKVDIICNKHGIFSISPANHILNKGCSKCGRERIGDAKRSTTESFVEKANVKHNNIYDYSKVVYKTNNTKVIISCSTHGDFKIDPAHHLNGQGCPECMHYGYKNHLTSYFYIQEIILDNKVVSYKFGITNRDVNVRMYEHSRKSIYEHKLIFTFDGLGLDIKNLEAKVKSVISGSYIDKVNMPHGYTETISPNDIGVLEELVLEYLLRI